jgi:hypothetical protein
MPLVVPDSAEVRLLEILVNKSSPTNLVLHLYTNEVDLSLENFTTDSFTEATAAGYAPVTLTGSNWTASTSTGISSASYSSAITFSFTEGVDVWGYYVTNTSDQIMWAEQFPGAPFTLPSTGGEIAVRPQIQLN